MNIPGLVITVVAMGLLNAYLIFALFRYMDRSKARCPACGGRGSGPHAFRGGRPLFVCRSCKKVFEKAQTSVPPVASR